MIDYSMKMIRIYLRCSMFSIWQLFNKKFLKTYRPDNNFTRCNDCGKDVHDFTVPNYLWTEVAKENEVLCYDCFCHRLEHQGIYKRMKCDWEWEE